ncbi:hypothetical protein JOF55_003812 [Haloactinomyces albus]|uniref:Uncharacterized protein n=1 Tax=Haloactinomyces albus TaxID=1352928 RepID=A0AAE3ZGT0_9ACTN|nr:hypothetical protein [Haloactinomyces albus]
MRDERVHVTATLVPHGPVVVGEDLQRFVLA